ncbi:hypothetical protein [Streptomyces sp. NPDC005438]|uniref:hypothetical protein n=1 Tax=Streptomyces sp. NPDC005438 TaxID=3156880 RepID=UPI0033AED108
MGWMDRLLGRTPPPEPVAAPLYADVGVPDLVEPLYARALVLAVDRGTATVDVQPPGRGSFRTELRSGTSPDSFRGLVPRWHVPVVLDASDPDTVVLLEPPCGPDLPLVPDDLQHVRDARDLRTSELTERYPPPSAARLSVLMEPTASAVHPAWDALCFRLGLLTTPEARTVLDRIRADGNAWQRAEEELYAWGPFLPDDPRKQVGTFFAHLDSVAPREPRIDSAPFWTFGVAALMRDFKPEETGLKVFERVMRPFVEVCGPLPEQLL